MSKQPCPRRVLKSLNLAAAAFAVAVVAGTSSLGMPTASATPQDDIWNLINDQHVAAGCQPYVGNQDLADSAVQLARSMASHDGQVPPTVLSTPELLKYHHYVASGYGDMRYYNPNGATPQDAVNFWLNANTRGLFPECGLQQLGVAVWIADNKWAAVALMGTPA